MKYKCGRCGYEAVDPERAERLSGCRPICVAGIEHPAPHDWQPVVELLKCCGDWIVASNQMRDHLGHHSNCSYFDEPKTMDDDIDLQLLVVDFGDSCAIKVEKGVFVGGRIPDNGIWGCRVKEGSSILCPHPFTNLRKCLDAMDSKPPVPRIEQDGSKRHRLFTETNEIGFLIWQCDLDALSELAGHPLPIYEPRPGEWTDLLPGFTVDIGWELPVKIWRYTRKK